MAMKESMTIFEYLEGSISVGSTFFDKVVPFIRN